LWVTMLENATPPITSVDVIEGEKVFIASA